jgi:predicted DNA-binding protein with PD1-like motif
MKYSEAGQGRIFVIRLEDGEIVHEVLERFARDQGVKAASLVIIGGADRESRLVVGPREARSSMPVDPIEHVLDNVHEVVGTGTIFPDEDGNPSLHMHMASGRDDSTFTGCIRLGVRVWKVMEAVLFELVDTTAARLLDPETGLKLLEP